MWYQCYFTGDSCFSDACPRTNGQNNPCQIYKDIYINTYKYIKITQIDTKITLQIDEKQKLFLLVSGIKE